VGGARRSVVLPSDLGTMERPYSFVVVLFLMRAAW
jgi:hypothetical protein